MKLKAFLGVLMTAVLAVAGKIDYYSNLTFDPSGPVPFKQADYFFEADFSAREPVWTGSEARNYQNRVVITFGAEKQGKKCLLVTHSEPPAFNDTAWQIDSKKQTYTGKPGKFVMDMDICSNVTFAWMRLDEGYGTQVKWFDAAGKSRMQHSIGTLNIRADSLHWEELT